jgi:hypothetical protein
MGAPASAKEAAERFFAQTGIDLASDPRLVAVHLHMITWRVVLATAEQEPFVEAIERAAHDIRARAMRPIPTFKPISLRTPPSDEQKWAQLLADALEAAMTRVSEGLEVLKQCVALAKASGLVEEGTVGRPEDALARALCLFLVEMVERRDVIDRMTSTQAALVAHAYGIAAPTGTWRNWTERWRVLMNDARTEQPGPRTARQRFLLAVREAQTVLVPRG